MTTRAPVSCGLVLLAACGLANPLARPVDGSQPRGRLRAGIASAKLTDDCRDVGQCTVQLSMGHTSGGWRRAEIVAVRLILDSTDLGEVPWIDVTRWRAGAYREWNHVVEPFRTHNLSIDLGPIRWDRVLEPLGPDHHPMHGDFYVEVDLEFDGEPLVVRSMFSVRREPAKIFMVT